MSRHTTMARKQIQQDPTWVCCQRNCGATHNRATVNCRNKVNKNFLDGKFGLGVAGFVDLKFERTPNMSECSHIRCTDCDATWRQKS